MMNKGSSTTVTIAAILQMLSAGLSIPIGLVVLAQESITLLGGGELMVILLLLLGAFGLITGLIALFLGIKLLHDQRVWSLRGSLIVQGMILIIQGGYTVLGHKPNFISIAFALGIIYFLMRPEVRELWALFSQPKQGKIGKILKSDP